ncbi:MAG: hypothetical protein ACK4TI_03025 [Nitrososphaerales archaeon]
MDLKKEDMDLLNRAISYSITLEDQGTVPRYGWETVDRIVKPPVKSTMERRRLYSSTTPKPFWK